MKIDGIVFDLDGTLIDTLEDLKDSVNFALAKFNFPARSLDEIRSFVGNGVKRLVYLSVPEGTSEETSEECLNIFKEHYKGNSRNKTAPYAGINEMLEKVNENGEEYILAYVPYFMAYTTGEYGDLWNQFNYTNYVYLPEGASWVHATTGKAYAGGQWLDVDAPIQAATIFALDQTYELAQMLGKENEVKEWKVVEKDMIKAARKHMLDKERGVILSGPQKQLSVLSQAWMTKAGVLTAKEAQKAIRTALADGAAVMPGTPYGTHYLIDAMLQCGMNEEARNYVIDYWGGMVEKGADTFWEAYDPKNDYISPYNFHPLNSYCHAWSCTPVYFIYTYPEIFCK